MGKINEFVKKTYTDKTVGEIFIACVLTMGAAGVMLCLVWFAHLVSKGIPLGWLIFDIAILAFCTWAIIKGIVPMSKDAIKHLENLDDNG